jgi:hypothetical protein
MALGIAARTPYAGDAQTAVPRLESARRRTSGCGAARASTAPPEATSRDAAASPGRPVRLVRQPTCLNGAPLDCERVCGAARRTSSRNLFPGESCLSTRRDRVGKVVEIKGVVIDAVFPDSCRRSTTRSRSRSDRDGEPTLIAEVQQHLGDDRVRAVAMDTTDGLSRGVDVVDTGAPISVPVGDATLGRIWNVIGDPVDQKPPAGKDVERWSITAILRRSASSRRRSRSSRPASRSSI